MTPALVFIAVPTLCYAGAAVVFAMRRDYHQMVIFSGYAFSNCGFLAIELMRGR